MISNKLSKELELLSEEESSRCNGGELVLATIAICTLLIAGFGLGYTVGKDAAERSRR